MIRRRHRPYHMSHAGTALDNDGYGNLVALWLLRLLLHHTQTRSGRALWFPGLEPLLATVGVKLDGEHPSRAVAKLPGQLRRALARLEKKDVPRRGAIFDNVALLAKVLRLDATSREVLVFATITSLHEALQHCLTFHATLSASGLRATLATTLQLDPEKIRKAFQPDAPLPGSGVLRMTRAEDGERLGLSLMEGMADVLVGEHADADSIVRSFFEPEPPSELKLEDFNHLQRDIDLLVPYLSASISQRSRGRNVLLYGPPGTGKTQFARTLADALGVNMQGVRVCDPDGGPAKRDRRLGAYQLCQRLLGRRGGLVLFDESEDAFPPDLGFAMFLGGDRERGGGRDKGWMVRLLETNPLPTIWISNNPQRLDPAYLRRFDLAIELSNPPRRVRRRILEGSLHGLPVPHGVLDRIAQNDHVTPADFDRAVTVARLIGSQAADATGKTIERVLAGRLTVRSEPAKAPQYGLDRETYDLAFLNADRDVAGLVEALERTPRGSLCLYGPPGTGKTALAHYVADRLGRPLVARRASDLLNPYVGMTEKFIAEMFREAEAEDAVLLLDEADSFLRDRRGARQSWEVTQVNELLVQMESFAGLFLCSTNLWGDLDEASLRRFDLKVEFRFLRPEQSVGLFERTLRALGVPLPEEPAWSATCGALKRLDNLTPGDFATVRRQVRLLPQLRDAAELLERLEHESRAKREHGNDRAIGFGA